jgi:DNA primase
MGTALTAEQAREISRLASVVLLCLDADAAGQQAAVRAASVLPERLELRVVPLPPGSDPADIVGEEGGADRMRSLLERSVPFARFQVERILAGGRDDDALTQVGSVIRPLPQGILRDELVKFASGRLGITPELVESAVRSAPPLSAPSGSAPPSAEQGGVGGPPPRAVNGARQAIDRREQSERAFLALCVALPELGEEKLAAADLDALFTSHLTRLAAERLRGHLGHPSSVIGETPELAELIPELVLRAGQLDATPATLELEALQLDLHRLDREITAARTGGEGEVRTLAAERQKVLDAIRHRLQ